MNTDTHPRRPTDEERAERAKNKADTAIAAATVRAHAVLRRKAERYLSEAHECLGIAAALMDPVDADKAGVLRALAIQLDSLELGPSE